VAVGGGCPPLLRGSRGRTSPQWSSSARPTEKLLAGGRMASVPQEAPLPARAARSAPPPAHSSAAWCCRRGSRPPVAAGSGDLCRCWLQRLAAGSRACPPRAPEPGCRKQEAAICVIWEETGERISFGVGPAHVDGMRIARHADAGGVRFFLNRRRSYREHYRKKLYKPTPTYVLY
jgi:hypothetical protein